MHFRYGFELNNSVHFDITSSIMSESQRISEFAHQLDVEAFSLHSMLLQRKLFKFIIKSRGSLYNIYTWEEKLCHFNWGALSSHKKHWLWSVSFFTTRIEYTKLYFTTNGDGYYFFLRGRSSKLSTASSPIGTNATNVFNKKIQIVSEIVVSW